MTNISTVYKCVNRFSDGLYYSLTASTLEDSWCVAYRVGKVSYPVYERSPLMAFESLAAADAFTISPTIECEAEIYPREHPIYQIHSIPKIYAPVYRDGVKVDRHIQKLFHDLDIITFWDRACLGYDLTHEKQRGYSDAFSYTVQIPLHTVFCKWVKPLREVRFGWK